MKAGTTWLYDKLRQHPEIHFSRAKEIHFLAYYYGHSSILDQQKRERRAELALQRLEHSNIKKEKLDRAKEWYQIYTSESVDLNWFELLTDAKNNTSYVADFSNLNCHLKANDWYQVKQNQACTLRVIYILRDPIARLWSHYKFHLEFSNHPLAGRPDQNFEHFQKIISKDWFWRNCCYSQSICELKCGLSDQELKIIYFEDMIHNPEATIREVELFLNVNPHPYTGNLKTAKNISTPCRMPDTWKQYARERLANELERLEQMKIYHPRWETLMNHS